LRVFLFHLSIPDGKVPGTSKVPGTCGLIP
jgi:hypothetical protein